MGQKGTALSWVGVVPIHEDCSGIGCSRTPDTVKTLLFSVLGVESRALYILGKQSTIESRISDLIAKAFEQLPCEILTAWIKRFWDRRRHSNSLVENKGEKMTITIHWAL